MLKQIRSSPGFAWWDDLWGSCAGRLEEQPLASGCVYPDLPGMQIPHPLHLQLQKDMWHSIGYLDSTSQQLRFLHFMKFSWGFDKTSQILSE